MFDRLNTLVASDTPCFFYTNYKGTKLHCYTIDELEDEDIEFSFNASISPQNSPHKPKYNPTTYQDYQKKFKRIQEHIKAGNSYLINLTQPTPIETPYTLKEIYTMAYAPYKVRIKNHFVSFSPEPFITIKDNIIHTHPMKGTIDASHSDAIETILNDPKEFAEHTMIVDLLRNDLGIVAKNIRVENFRYITTIDTGIKKLHQVSSHICGNLDNNWRENIGSILKALLPAGSISGTPKKRTLEIIEEIEDYDRGYFSGIFGYYDGTNLYSAVAIRFIENSDEKLIYKSGGGITCESNCKKEYQEMIDKIYIP